MLLLAAASIEGLSATRTRRGEARHEEDVAQCGYCQPGRIMAAVALVRKVRAQGREITDDLDGGACTRIRTAIKKGEART